MKSAPVTATPFRRVEARRERKAARRTRVARLVASAVSLVLVIPLVVMPLLGIRPYVITGDSMHGAIARGALIFTRTVPVDSLEVGDIVTYRPPDGSSALVTHRIVSLEPGTDGKAVLTTKGDANETADPWQATLDRSEQARYIAQIPLLGYLVAILATPLVRACLFALPAVITAVWLFGVIWRRTDEPAEPDASAPRTPWEEKAALRHPSRKVLGERR